MVKEGMSISKSKKERLKKIMWIGIFILVINIPLLMAQVINTQVIDLSEKTRDFFVEASKGNIAGQSTLNINAHNEDLGTTQEDIQEQGGTLVFLESAEIISFSSTDAADTILGDGARTILIIGLDENFTEISETVNLSGITSVNTTNEYMRINNFRVDSVGVYNNTNIGDLTATAFFANTIQSFILTGDGIAHTSHYTVPSGQNVIIVSISSSIQTGKTVEMQLHTRDNADDITAPVSPILIVKDFHGIEGSFQLINKANLVFDEKTDIWFSGLTSSGTTSDLELNYDLVQYAIGT